MEQSNNMTALRTKQIGGNHYQCNIQPWDVFLDWQLDPWLCNVIKYVQRHHKKGGLDDLKKAHHYLEYAIENYDTIKERFYRE
jgi:hypothetical protein